MLSVDRTLVVILPDALGGHADFAFEDLREEMERIPGCTFLAPESLDSASIDEAFCAKEAKHMYEQISSTDAKRIVLLAPSYGTTLTDAIVEKYQEAFAGKGQQLHVIQLDPTSEFYRSCCKKGLSALTLEDCAICAADFNESIQGIARSLAIPLPRMSMPFKPQHFFDIFQSKSDSVANLSGAMRAFSERIFPRKGMHVMKFTSYLNRMLSIALTGQNVPTKTAIVSQQRFFSREMLGLMREIGIAATTGEHLELIGYRGSFPPAVISHVKSFLTAHPAPVMAPAEGGASADGSGGASGSYVFAAPPEGVGLSMMAIWETRSVDG